MKIAYYPGCTLKTKARGLEDSALAALAALGAEVEELPRWNCCGALFSLATDDLIHQVAPVRNLVRAQENGAEAIVTLCAQCYNTLARANLMMREDEEKRDTINRFMDEEPDYTGGVEVVHYLNFLKDSVGFDKLRAAVKQPLEGLKVGPFYGCSLVRPGEVGVEGAGERLFADFLAALGAEPVEFGASRECCGSYQSIIHPEADTKRVGTVLGSAKRAGVEALALSCPMCEYNLGTRQGAVLAATEGLAPIPTYYFTQLLAVALGLEPAVCRFDLAGAGAAELMQERNYVSAGA